MNGDAKYHCVRWSLSHHTVDEYSPAALIKMRFAAVPLRKVALSDLLCSLPLTCWLLVASKASFSVYKADLSIEVFHYEGLAQACIFPIHGLGLNIVERRLNDAVVFDESIIFRQSVKQSAVVMISMTEGNPEK